MIVRCSQCGAKINRKDENRFFSCPYCASALVLEGGRSFACFIMQHERNDLWARALFHERLKQAGVAPDRGKVTVEFTYIPFWVVRRPDGSIAAHPAAETHHRDLSSIKVPPGRLIFYEQDSRPDAPVIALSVPLNLAFDAEKKEDLGHVDLVYLPVYFMESANAGGQCALTVVGDSSRPYWGVMPAPKRYVSARPLAFFGAVAALFVVSGLLIDGVYLRAAAIGAGGLVCAILSHLILGRQRQ